MRELLERVGTAGASLKRRFGRGTPLGAALGREQVQVLLSDMRAAEGVASAIVARLETALAQINGATGFDGSDLKALREDIGRTIEEAPSGVKAWLVGSRDPMDLADASRPSGTRSVRAASLGISVDGLALPDAGLDGDAGLSREAIGPVLERARDRAGEAASQFGDHAHFLKARLAAPGGASVHRAAPKGAKVETEENPWVENTKLIVFALLLALTVRAFFFQPFNIPSGSMRPTLLVGDYLFVSKFSYGYSRHSFYFGFPPFNGRVLASEPSQGDVAVFKYPRDNKTDYIKRIVGMPGDDIQMIRGVLHINDEPVQRRLVGEFKNWRCDGTVLPRVPIYEETLPNGHTYRTLDAFQRLPLDNTPKVTVKEGHYFMMGDNRDCSQDSRAPFVGQVPFENMVGKAEILFFSINSEKFGIRFGRIFNLIR